MTTRNEANKALNDELLSQFGTSFPSVPVTLDNESFDADKEGDPEYVRGALRNRDSDQVTIGPVGSRRFDRLAGYIVQLYTAVDTGTERSDELADFVKEIFEGRTIGGVKLYASTARVVSNGPKWRQVNVETDLFYEDKR